MKDVKNTKEIEKDLIEKINNRFEDIESENLKVFEEVKDGVECISVFFEYGVKTIYIPFLKDSFFENYNENLETFSDTIINQIKKIKNLNYIYSL